MADLRARAQAVADELIGQCATDVTGLLTDDEANNPDLMREIDDLCFCCDSCGWWCGIEDLAESLVCNECEEDNVQ